MAVSLAKIAPTGHIIGETYAGHYWGDTYRVLGGVRGYLVRVITLTSRWSDDVGRIKQHAAQLAYDTDHPISQDRYCAYYICRRRAALLWDGLYGRGRVIAARTAPSRAEVAAFWDDVHRALREGRITQRNADELTGLTADAWERSRNH
jgi:hypothetical protein